MVIDREVSTVSGRLHAGNKNDVPRFGEFLVNYGQAGEGQHRFSVLLIEDMVVDDSRLKVSPAVLDKFLARTTLHVFCQIVQLDTFLNVREVIFPGVAFEIFNQMAQRRWFTAMVERMSIVRKHNDARCIGTGDTAPLAERCNWVYTMFQAVRCKDEVVRLIGDRSKLRRFTDDGEARLPFFVIFERFASRGRRVYRGTVGVVA